MNRIHFTHFRLIKPHFSFYLIALLLSPLTTFGTPESTQQQEPLSYLQTIKTQHFKSLGLKPERVTPPDIQIKSGIDMIKSLWMKPYNLPELNTYEKRELAFKASGTDTCVVNTVISATTAQKIELVSNSGAKSDQHLAHFITTTTDENGKTLHKMQTESGNAVLVKKISQPHTNLESIAKTQRTITAFTTNDTLLTDLTATLKNIGEGENHFLSFYNTYKAINPETTQKLYWSLLKPLNNSSLGLEAGTRLNHLMAAILSLEIEAIVGFSLYKAGVTPLALIQAIIQDPAAILVPLAPCIPLGIFMKFMGAGYIKPSIEVGKALQTQLIGAASYINGAKKLYTLLHKNPEVVRNFDSLSALESLVKPSNKRSAEFNELISLLDTRTFTGKASLLSFSGRILRAHTLMNTESVQKELEAVVNAIGEIDIYVALAHKISTSKDKEVGYCFVEFDTTSTNPSFKADGLWNPFVSEAHAVTNTVELGGTKPRNIVLSGPNTGGKSTVSKAILINAILAQTFGIAAASQMIITPFSNLDCYMNMTDDTASGVSGLKAEVNRAKELIAKLKNTSGFSLILLDEIFTATSPDQAEKLAAGFIKNLSEQPNSLFIDCAHFEALIKFAEESKDCRNCHMGAIVDKEGKVVKYTYKLAEGRSTVKNAEQVAQEGNAVW